MGARSTIRANAMLKVHNLIDAASQLPRPLLSRMLLVAGAQPARCLPRSRIGCSVGCAAMCMRRKLGSTSVRAVPSRFLLQKSF
jgi:hypothetical protein